MEAPSFASRRPAATSLPAFSLPPPDIPSTRYPAPSPGSTAPSFGSSAQSITHMASSLPHSPPPVATQSLAPQHFSSISRVLTHPSGVTTDGLSPLASSVNSGSSQSSQPVSTPGLYYSHVASTWANAGASSSPYGYASSGANHSNSSSLGQQTYPSARQMYPTASPSVQQHFGQAARTITSPGMADSLPNSSYQESSSLLNPVSGGGGGGGGGSQQTHGPTQQQNSAAQNTPTSGPPPSDNNYRSSYYTPSTTAQPPSFSAFSANQGTQHNSSVSSAPPSSAAAPRTAPMAGHVGSLSAMAPPIGFGASEQTHPQSSFPRYHHHLSGNPVLSNMHHPGTPLAMVGGVSGMGMPQGFGAHGHHHSMGIYGAHGHGQPAPQQERPFKCDQCPQSFNRNHDLKRHKRIHLAVKPFPCTFCEKSFSRKDALKRHRLVKGCGEKQPSGGCGEKQSPGDGHSPGTTATDSLPPDKSEIMSDGTDGSPVMAKKEQMV